jgi:hypothetical protein
MVSISMMTFEDLCIAVYYPCSAGGKFIINSLGLSKHCVLHDADLAQWELEQTDVNLLYNKKLEVILKTVPENAFDGNWQKYELGSSWIKQKNSIQDPDPADLQKIINGSKHFCIVCHEFDQLQYILSRYPKTRVVKLTNYADWMILCKSKTRITDVDEKIIHWSFVDKNEIESPTVDWILVDIDDSMKSMTKMQKQIQMLYSKLGFDDFDESRWCQYYIKYAQSHSIEVLEN